MNSRELQSHSQSEGKKEHKKRTLPQGKYSFSPFHYSHRSWPAMVLDKAPSWCSVDLRDGNQALINPMNMEKKLEMFQCLIAIGFKEIEVGFPAASEIEYAFIRKLIEDNLIPEDVTVQVLTQAREHLIERTMRSIEGAKRAIVHLYNSTSIAQREQVFSASKTEVVEIALRGVQAIQKNVSSKHGELVFQYSPESFTATEPEFALDICERVHFEWKKNPTSDEKVIINLPATVELFGPHLYADRIEWFCKNFASRDEVIISLHTHNDRGTGVAATELGLLAGAERVEGTLFGNGERTGNVDIVTLALNLEMHGVASQLDFSDIPSIIRVSQHCTELDVPMRHPYAGELVFTAFSGSHQDAIKKGFAHRASANAKPWDLPYLAVDPEDIGRTYQAIIRINAQSGKGGIAYVLEKQFGYALPKKMQIDFSQIVQRYSDEVAQEVSPQKILSLFKNSYLDFSKKKPLLKLVGMLPNYKTMQQVLVELDLLVKKGVEGIDQSEKDDNDGEYAEYRGNGQGNGPIDAALNALKSIVGEFKLVDYSEHTLSQGSSASAIAYIEIEKNGTFFGAGIDPNITVASVKALINALNRSFL